MQIRTIKKSSKFNDFLILDFTKTETKKIRKTDTNLYLIISLSKLKS